MSVVMLGMKTHFPEVTVKPICVGLGWDRVIFFRVTGMGPCLGFYWKLLIAGMF